MEKLRLFELFAGYGGASFALKKANIPFECVGYSEIDKFAIQCYEQNHSQLQGECCSSEPPELIPPKNYGNIRKIDPNKLPDFDFLTGGFPCQAFSVAGKGLGEQDERGTLFYEIVRIAKIKQPKYMLLENVKGLLSFKFTFERILQQLNNIGYRVFWKVLNSKEYGTPQNRERVWFVCIRKDIFEPFKFQFPLPIKLERNMFDLLEENANKKYFLNEKQVLRILKNNNEAKNDIAHCLTASQNMKQSKNMSVVADFRHDEGLRVRKDNISLCLTSTLRSDGISNSILLNDTKHWRRMTPRECFRCMGFFDDEININDLSDTQAYKIAGNGWEIGVVTKILTNLLEDYK